MRERHQHGSIDHPLLFLPSWILLEESTGLMPRALRCNLVYLSYDSYWDEKRRLPFWSFLSMIIVSRIFVLKYSHIHDLQLFIRVRLKNWFISSQWKRISAFKNAFCYCEILCCYRQLPRNIYETHLVEIRSFICPFYLVCGNLQFRDTTDCWSQWLCMSVKWTLIPSAVLA